MVSLDLRHTKEVFQHLFHKSGICFNFPAGKLPGSLLQSAVTEEEEDKTDKENESDTVVKEKEHENNKAGGKQALRNLHNHAGSHIFQHLHGVCCDRADLSEGILIKIAHGKVTEVLRDFHSFPCAGIIARFGLQHHAF